MNLSLSLFFFLSFFLSLFLACFLSLWQIKAAVITMIGSYGATIAESPYLIEELIDKWATHDEIVKYALLHSTMNIFFLVSHLERER